MQTEYDFILGFDFEGNDIMRIRDASVEKLKTLSDLIPYCRGFNTNGFLKRFICLDNLVEWPNEFDPEERCGLYVKSSETYLKELNNRCKHLCVNLSRRPDRMNRMKCIFAENQIEVEFFAAIDGKKLLSTDNRLDIFRGNSFRNRRGIMGCALSHYLLWEKLATDTEFDYYVIYEDDIELVDDYKNKFSKIFESYTKIKNPGVLYLGFTMTKKHLKENYKKYRLKDNVQMEMMEIIDNEIYGGGAFGYILNKNVAISMMEFVKNNGIKIEVDWMMMRANIIMRSCLPHLVLTRSVQNDSYEVDSDIQKDYDKIQLELIENESLIDGYEFFPNKDSFGGDILEVANLSIEQMKEIADSLDQCVGFNTYGWFKTKISEEDEFITLDNMNYKNEGLYVKKN